MRVVVELRRDANLETVLAELQRRTALQSNYGAILLALVNDKPIQLTLRQLLQEFLDDRELTLIRRNRLALKRAENRLEVVEGLIRPSCPRQLDRDVHGRSRCRRCQGQRADRA